MVKAKVFKVVRQSLHRMASLCPSDLWVSSILPQHQWPVCLSWSMSGLFPLKAFELAVPRALFPQKSAWLSPSLSTECQPSWCPILIVNYLLFTFPPPLFFSTWHSVHIICLTVFLINSEVSIILLTVVQWMNKWMNFKFNYICSVWKKESKFPLMKVSLCACYSSFGLTPK